VPDAQPQQAPAVEQGAEAEHDGGAAVGRGDEGALVAERVLHALEGPEGVQPRLPVAGLEAGGQGHGPQAAHQATGPGQAKTGPGTRHRYRTRKSTVRARAWKVRSRQRAIRPPSDPAASVVAATRATAWTTWNSATPPRSRFSISTGTVASSRSRIASRLPKS